MITREKNCFHMLTYIYADIADSNPDCNSSIHCIPCRWMSFASYNRPVDKHRSVLLTLRAKIYERQTWDFGLRWSHCSHMRAWRMFYRCSFDVDCCWSYIRWLFHRDCAWHAMGERRREEYERRRSVESSLTISSEDQNHLEEKKDCTYRRCDQNRSPCNLIRDAVISHELLAQVRVLLCIEHIYIYLKFDLVNIQHNSERGWEAKRKSERNSASLTSSKTRTGKKTIVSVGFDQRLLATVVFER